MSLDGLLQGAGALLLMPVQEATAAGVGALARSIEGQLRDAEGVERSAMRSTAAIKVVRDQVTAMLARCIAMSAPRLPATPAASSSSSATSFAAAPAADEGEDEIEVEVEDEGAGAGASAGAGAGARKRPKRELTDEERLPVCGQSCRRALRPLPAVGHRYGYPASREGHRGHRVP
jgi:hypothetical protein